jgi:cytochrome c oxidase subunit 2
LLGFSGGLGPGYAELGAPALAGQHEAYLARQLTHFRSGIRGGDARDTLGAQMKAMAAPLSDDDIDALADYLAGLAAPAPAAVRGDFNNGRKLYQGNCGACHGAQAEGNPALNAPGLAWLDAAYMKRQYDNYREGLRGAHPDDTHGRQMKAMSNSLATEKDLDDVIAYMQSLALE